MDEFPGLMFEPASLHKYLYCEGNPVGRWDLNGRLTLLETTLTIVDISILFSEIISIRLHFLKAWVTPIEWKGTIVSYTLGAFAEIGIHNACFESESINNKIGRGNYLIIVAGIMIGITNVYAGASIFNVILETPGIFGPDPVTLAGPVAWISASIIYGGRLLNISNTISQMGFGRTHKSYKIGRGEGVWDVGVDIMGGVSLKTSSW